MVAVVPNESMVSLMLSALDSIDSIVVFNPFVSSTDEFPGSGMLSRMVELSVLRSDPNKFWNSARVSCAIVVKFGKLSMLLMYEDRSGTELALGKPGESMVVVLGIPGVLYEFPSIVTVRIESILTEMLTKIFGISVSFVRMLVAMVAEEDKLPRVSAICPEMVVKRLATESTVTPNVVLSLPVMSTEVTLVTMPEMVLLIMVGDASRPCAILSINATESLTSVSEPDFNCLIPTVSWPEKNMIMAEKALPSTRS